MPLTLSANAKINLGLRIVGRREDPSGRTGGYHLLHTLFQEIDFGDQVTLAEMPSSKITLEVSGSAAREVPTDENNLSLQAARLFKKRTAAERGVHIRLDKRIPVGAGLGGGSSDAAAVLGGVNELWEVGLSQDELEEVAAHLGADVPFFIRGGLQLGAGIGEQLKPLEPALPYAIVLVIPPLQIDTAWAYGQFDLQQKFPSPPAFDGLITRDPIPWEAFSNDFEAVVFPHYEQLADIKKGLLAAGAVYAGLSGSGSAVFGLFEGRPSEEEVAHRFPGSQVVVCRAVSRG